MGTPDFAVAALDALYKTGEYDISVITQPDKPKGRGYELLPTEVKKYALERGLPVFQPVTMKSEEAEELIRNLDPDVIVVAAYGKILPSFVLDYPKYGCINVHGSLLPEYRGAAPIQRAIIDGKKVTGITVMKMDVGLDTGDMFAKTEVEITPDDDFGTLFDKMAEAGGRAITETLPKIISGELKPEKQDDTLSCYAAKIEKDDCRIGFTDDAEKVVNRIRGLSPVPLAFTFRGNGVQLKIVSAKLTDEKSGKPCGCAYGSDDGIKVVCGDGRVILLTEIIPAGKKRMKAADYLRGNKIDGEIFTASPC
ncbi:MAG: methionyl-tRNA formyltransferase [Firmicutes bacterium]|nr:methionyl-tRNA formyltransferase [Candidatus Colimorpha enterica]